MEETQPKTGNYALKFGLLAGAIGLVFSLMLFFQDLHYEQSLVNFAIGVAILFGVIAFALNQYKKDNGGFLKLSNALKIGTGIGLIAIIIGLIWSFLLTSDVIEPGYMEKAMAIAKEKQMEANPQMTDEQWNQGVEMQKKFMWVGYAIITIGYCLLGLIGGLIFGLIMKKDRPA